mmetsp:Transcript_1346/g.2793  ORF Transcript_1346/g.2793 Transcript_1346/m.2793 type:complete len:213 (+) Transcript_1346:114-752(+)
MIFMSTTTFHDIKECQIKCCAMSVYTHTTLPATAIATLSTALYRTEPEQLRTNITRNAVFTRVTNLHSSIEPVFLLNPCITCEVQNSQQHSPMPWNVAEIDFGFDYLNRIRLLICRNRHQYALLQYLYQPLEIGSTTSQCNVGEKPALQIWSPNTTQYTLHHSLVQAGDFSHAPLVFSGGQSHLRPCDGCLPTGLWDRSAVRGGLRWRLSGG